jgi:hypothetical protein
LCASLPADKISVFFGCNAWGVDFDGLPEGDSENVRALPLFDFDIYSLNHHYEGYTKVYSGLLNPLEV